MNAPIDFRVDSASVAQIAEHLARCDAQFVPPLSGRVELGAYARKLAERATRHEAWSEATLVGLVAMYRDREARRGFVSNVSVLPGFAGAGLGRQLLQRCLDAAGGSGLREVRLEVGRDNARARRLYDGLGFTALADDAAILTMVLNLGTETTK